MLGEYDKQYYFLVNPEDFDLFMDILHPTKKSVVTNQAFLIDPIYCGLHGNKEIVAGEALKIMGDKLFQLEEIPLKERLKVCMDLSQAMLKIPEKAGLLDKPEDVVFKSLLDLGLIRRHYDQIVYKYDKLNIKQNINLAKSRFYEFDEYNCINSGRLILKPYIIGLRLNAYLLTDTGFSAQGWTSRAGILFGDNNPQGVFTRDATKMSKSELKGAIQYTTGYAVVANEETLERIPETAELRTLLNGYKARLSNKENIMCEEESDTHKLFTEEFFDLCLEQTRSDIMKNALENKLLVCNEGTVMRDYGFRKVSMDGLTELERRHTCQQVNKGLYYMAQLLGIPETGIGFQRKMDFIIDGNTKQTKNKITLAYFSPREPSIHLSKDFGLGSIAHEWFHALDHFVGYNGYSVRIKPYLPPYTCGYDSRWRKVITQIGTTEDVQWRDEGSDFVESMIKDPTKKLLPWYKESKNSWSPKYFTTPTELLARAGSRVVRLKANREGIYDSALFHTDDVAKYHPSREEAEYIEPIVDKFVEDALDDGIFG